MSFKIRKCFNNDPFDVGTVISANILKRKNTKYVNGKYEKIQMQTLNIG